MYLDSFRIVFAGVACCTSERSVLELSITPSALPPPPSSLSLPRWAQSCLNLWIGHCPTPFGPEPIGLRSPPATGTSPQSKLPSFSGSLHLVFGSSRCFWLKVLSFLLLGGSAGFHGSIWFRQDRYLGRLSILTHCSVSCAALALGSLGHSDLN